MTSTSLFSFLLSPSGFPASHHPAFLMTRTLERFAREAVRESTVGPWQLLHLVDEGNYTRVFTARPLSGPTSDGADYVLKVIKPEFQGSAEIVRRLATEAFLGRSVSHPNLIAVLSANVDEPPYYLVQPCLAGSTLQTLSASGRDLSLPFILWIARQTAQGLQELHQRGWLHGDVNPTNIFISPQAHATLIDFGMARQIGVHPSGDDWSGTLAYAAPELFVSSRRIGAEADVYSLGVTLFEQLTGTLPFQAEDASKLAVCHLRQPPPDPKTLCPQLPTRVNWLVKRMLAKEPLRRPSVEELIGLFIQLEVEYFDER